MPVVDVVKTWDTGDGHAAKTQDVEVRGTIVAMHAIITSVTDNPTVTITLRDQNSVIVVPDAVLATLADGTIHYKVAISNKATQDADFNPAPVSGTLTISITPSADPGGTGQTLSVTFRLFLRDDL